MIWKILTEVKKATTIYNIRKGCYQIIKQHMLNNRVFVFVDPHLSATKYCKTKYNTTIYFWGSNHIKTLNKVIFFCFCFNYKWCKKQKIIKQWSFIKKYKIMIVCKKTDKWYIAWNRLTTSDNEWQRVVQWMTNSDNKWPRVVQRTTTSDTTSDSE